MNDNIKIGVVSLGCDKNRVDTENMLAVLAENGCIITPDPREADVIIVNTCAFIESAKEEAVNTIFEMSEYKSGSCKFLIATGCLPQRYMSELKDSMPEVDAFLGTGNYGKIYEVICDLYDNSGLRIAMSNDKDKRDFSSERYLTTPYHYAYLKIAEGCDNRCTYCAIPSIRGKYTSREMGALIDEAKYLTDEYGVKELNIVAQDVTKYGLDIYGRYALIELIEELSKLEIKWIRLLYCYPELVNDELIKEIVNNPKVCNYIDIPLQHISDSVLKLMNRRVNGGYIRDLIARLRSQTEHIEIRSTFIVGFPRETEEDHAMLKSFIREYKLDKCGFFAYSREEGTPAYKLSGQIDRRTKNARQKELYAIQNGIMLEKAREKAGKVFPVIYEGIDYDRQSFIGRSIYDAPEIDSNIYFSSDTPLDIGNIYNVKVTGNDGIDLIGKAVEKQ